MDAVVKRKIPSPRRQSNLRTPIVQPVHDCCTTRNRRNINHITGSQLFFINALFWIMLRLKYWWR